MSLLLHDVLSPELLSRRGDAVAVVQGERSVTFRALDEASSRLAALLHAKAGALPTPLVGVTSAVTIESVIGILGVLKAGLAYVPLDIRSPPDRLARIVRDAKLEVLLLDALAFPEAPALAAVESVKDVISLEPSAPAGPRALAWREALDRPPLAAPVKVLIDDLAYVLYTSGSTGEPKGVMLTHRNARTFVDWMEKEFQVTSEDRLMSRSPLNFDLSVFDVFNALKAGATLIVHDGRQAKHEDGPARHRAYVDTLRKHRATILYTTPSTFMTLLDKGGLDATCALRLMLYAGEPFRPPLLKQLMLALPKTKVANIYGPTETNIVTCYWLPGPPEGTQPIPIGVEVDDTDIIVVDDAGRRCGVGEVGELWVRGGTVCVGYFGKDELTAQRLVKSPFHPFPAWYWRTGDYGFRREDGVLVYHGRLDNMVKTRGYRVELGDVESAIAQLPEVSIGAVVPLPHERHGSVLVALVVPREGKTVSVEALKAHLTRTLPEYMVPVAIEVRGELPSTSTGKVDRQRLIAELKAARQL
ncbi:MAG: amino acid adenylation domain-containing protein [Myxococcota bacterium]